MNYELRITNYAFEWHADTPRPFPTRFDRFRNKFGMTGSIIGFFQCSRFAFALPSLPQALKGVPPMLRQTYIPIRNEITIRPKCRFSGSELLHPPGRRSRVTKAERRKTGRNPNKIFHLALSSPLPPNKINFRNASRRRKFGIIPPTTQQPTNQQINDPADPQIRKSATAISSQTAHTFQIKFLSQRLTRLFSQIK